MRGPPWTDWGIETLKAKLLEGWSASQIAAVIGVSKNAVIGKVHRLGLGRKRKPLSLNGDAVWSRAKRARRKAGEIKATEVAVVEEPAKRVIRPFRNGNPTPPRPVSLGEDNISLPAPGCVELSRRSGAADAILHLRNIECAWPIGAVETEDFHFCCASVRKPGEPYCVDHMRMAVRM